VDPEEYELESPHSQEQWQHYHDIRRRVLWEARGRFEVYDETHPDEHKPGNFPLLFRFRAKAIGVIRIDIEGERAIFRRVAIREDLQRQGHGTQLMRLVERFAEIQGCTYVYSFVDPGAVSFYEKCGFRHDHTYSANPLHVGMQKTL
jgi:GNAT superfamily N-acetyltransferase